jgi:hypothetical protein
MPELSKIQIIGIAGFIIVLISIPLAFILLRENQALNSKASEKKNGSNSPVTIQRAVPSGSPMTDFQKFIDDATGNTNSGSGSAPTPGTSESVSYGSTLNFKVALEGRPVDKQATKMFVGIASGSTSTSPTFLLTFTVNIPDTGLFKGLSLAGLNSGSVYTVYLKGSAQIDSSSTFTMSPTENNLNNSTAINLLTGDLNEDNTINSLDYSIARGLYGTTPNSSNWNPNADFNKDGIVNSYDLAFISKNMGKTGASSTWFSPAPLSTPSASPTPTRVGSGSPQGFADLLDHAPLSSTPSAENTPNSYWLFVP